MGNIRKYDAPAGDPQDAPAPRKKAGALQTFRLGSNHLVNTPGFVRYLRNAVRGQKKWAFQVLREGTPACPTRPSRSCCSAPSRATPSRATRSLVTCVVSKPRKQKEAA